MAFLPVETGYRFAQFFCHQQERRLLGVDHVAQAHSDVIHFTAPAAPVFIGVWCADDDATHHHAVLSFTSSYHKEPIADMCFLIVPDAPVIVEAIHLEIIHRFLKLAQLVVADVSVPPHDEGLAEMLLDNAFGFVKQFAPPLFIHLVEKSLGCIHSLELTLTIQQLAEILELHHLAGVLPHHTHILAGTYEDIIRIVHHPDRTEFLIIRDVSFFLCHIHSIRIGPLQEDKIPESGRCAVCFFSIVLIG